VGYAISYDLIVGWDEDLRLLTERVAGSLFTRPEPRATNGCGTSAMLSPP